METLFVVRYALAIFQVLALGLLLGFDNAKDCYEHFKKLTTDENIKFSFDEKIKEANIVSNVCLFIIFINCVIILVL